MKIGIIGTGFIGSTIAKKLVEAKHTVYVTNSDPSVELERKAQEIGATAVDLNGAVQGVDLVILSIPTKAVSELPKDLFEKVPENVIVVETTNYYPFRDHTIADLDNGKVESIWVSEQLGRPVIKAFNNLLAYSLANEGRPTGTADRLAMAVSGDDAQAKKTVSSLINDLGFDAVDAGSLADSWKHQPGTPAYCTDLNAGELTQAIGDGNKDKASELREFAIQQIMDRGGNLSNSEILEINRALHAKNPKSSSK